MFQFLFRSLHCDDLKIYKKMSKKAENVFRFFYGLIRKFKNEEIEVALNKYISFEYITFVLNY